MTFKKGSSGNPGGRPRVVGHVRELAQSKIELCIQVLVEALSDDDVRVRIAAAQMLLDRGCGKPSPVDEERVLKEELAKMTDEALDALHAAEQKSLKA